MLNRILAIMKRRKSVVYDGTFFTDAWFENWAQLKHVLWELIQEMGRWKSILDFGCGPGVMIDFMNLKGYDYYGWDSSDEARQLYLRHFGRFSDKYMLSWDQCSLHQYDLLISFDVFEHMCDESIADLLKQVSRIPEMVVNISRSRSTPGHINIKSDHQWIGFFDKNGWKFSKDDTEKLRTKYLEIRPQATDLWHRNLFIFSK